MAQFIFLMTFLFFQVAAFAEVTRENCKNKDFSEQFGPVRNQGAVANCFSFAAADLIAFNQGLLPGDTVSAMDVNVNYLTADPQGLWSAASTNMGFSYSNFIGHGIVVYQRYLNEMAGRPLLERIQVGGSLNLAILAYNQRNKLCLEKDLRSEQSIVFQESPSFFQNQILRMSQISASSRQGQDFNSENDEPLGISCSLRNQSTSPEQLNDFSLTVLNETARKACHTGKPLRPMVPEAYSVNEKTRPYTDALIARMISIGMPAGIGYDPAFLRQGNTIPRGPADHASIIVGTRWNLKDQRCEFKLRNSWGALCTSFHESFRDRCEAGNIWITSDELKQRTDLIVGINPQK